MSVSLLALWKKKHCQQENKPSQPDNVNNEIPEQGSQVRKRTSSLLLTQSDMQTNYSKYVLQPSYSGDLLVIFISIKEDRAVSEKNKLYI